MRSSLTDHSVPDDLVADDLLTDERGQATAEYALVIVAAAAVALALIVWATSTDMLPSFFTAVLQKVTAVANGASLG
jgi:Flp pilus assembly pilin Flp